jgi:hypothetical protein
VAVPIDIQLAAPEVESRLALLRPRAVIVLRDSHSVTRNAAVRHGLTVIEAAAEECGRLGLCFDVPRTGPPALLEDPEPAAPAFILQTSGTTAAHQHMPDNNSLERILREIRRRTHVVGAFPDGQPALNLAAARAASHRRHRVVHQEIFEHRAAEGPAMRGAITA